MVYLISFAQLASIVLSALSTWYFAKATKAKLPSRLHSSGLPLTDKNTFNKLLEGVKVSSRYNLIACRWLTGAIFLQGLAWFLTIAFEYNHGNLS